MKEIKISSDNINQLEDLKEASPASIRLKCLKASHETLDQVFNLLKDQGEALAELELSLIFPSDPFVHNLQDFDFAQYCPNLTSLILGRCKVGESVLNHPKIKLLVLDESWIYTQNPFELGVKEDAYLKELVLNDTNWSNEKGNNVTLIIGPKSCLKRFDYSLDEDYVSACTDRIEVKDAPHLQELYGNICASWKVIFSGSLPSVKKLYGTGGQYGRVSFDFSEVSDDSSKYIVNLRDIRKSK